MDVSDGSAKITLKNVIIGQGNIYTILLRARQFSETGGLVSKMAQQV